LDPLAKGFQPARHCRRPCGGYVGDDGIFTIIRHCDGDLPEAIPNSPAEIASSGKISPPRNDGNAADVLVVMARMK